MKKKNLILLLVIIPFLYAFDYNDFPDLAGKTPMRTIYSGKIDIVWEIFDSNGDGEENAAIGYKPILFIPDIKFTPSGPRIDWLPIIKNVSASYYWKDLNGDSLPFKNDLYDLDEILYDPKENGLNGDEEYPFLLRESIGS